MGRFILRGVLSTLLAVALFLAAIFLVFLPAFEQTILQRKREMIPEQSDILAEDHPQRTGKALQLVRADTPRLNGGPARLEIGRRRFRGRPVDGDQRKLKSENRNGPDPQHGHDHAQIGPVPATGS